MRLAILVVRASDLRLNGREFDPRPPRYTVGQGLNYFQRGVGALLIQWPMVEICELRCNAKICDFIQVIIAVIQQQSISFKLEKIDNILLIIRSQ